MLALVESGELALERIDAPDDAAALLSKIATVDEALRRMHALADEQLRAGKLRLRAERRLGELLPVAKIGRPSAKCASDHVSTVADRSAKRRARQLAAVPAPTFEAYLASATDPDELRRARLLRATAPVPAKAEDVAAAPVVPDVETHTTAVADPDGDAVWLLLRSGDVDGWLDDVERQPAFDRVDVVDRLGKVRALLSDAEDQLLARAQHAAPCQCARPIADRGNCFTCGRRLASRQRPPTP
jgi:hypothetical protein